MKSKWLAIALIMVTTVAISFAGGSSEPVATAAKPQAIHVWGWDNSDLSKKTYAAFQAAYPQYYIETTIIQRQDMEQKLQTALASGADVPDVAWIESTYRGSLFAMDIWEDASKPPLNIDLNNVLPYLLPLETTAKGVYVGPEVPSIGGMAYKRALAKQYLGTDDPQQLKAMFPTWEAFVEKGKEVLKKSGGKVYMMSSPWNTFIFKNGQTNAPYVVNDTQLNLKAAATPILQLIYDMKKAGIVDTYEANSPAENTSYTDETHIFYPCANWSVTFTIKRNDPNGSGRWGFIVPPDGGFPMGGTVQGIPKKAKNKIGAVTFLKYRYLSEAGAKMLRDWQGYFAPLKSLYKDDKFYDLADPFFGGQNLQKIFAQDILAKIKDPRRPNKYDQQVASAFNVAIQKINTGADVNVADLVTLMETELMQRNPELKR